MYVLFQLIYLQVLILFGGQIYVDTVFETVSLDSFCSEMVWVWVAAKAVMFIP